jgi:hypothetical protein
MRRIIVLLTVAALMSTFGVGAAAAQGPSDQAQGPPVGGCPASYEPGLVPVEVVVAGAGLEEPDPSMDPNGDGYTCLKILHTGSGTRATWHDNVIPL